MMLHLLSSSTLPPVVKVWGNHILGQPVSSSYTTRQSDVLHIHQRHSQIKCNVYAIKQSRFSLLSITLDNMQFNFLNRGFRDLISSYGHPCTEMSISNICDILEILLTSYQCISSAVEKIEISEDINILAESTSHQILACMTE